MTGTYDPPLSELVSMRDVAKATGMTHHSVLQAARCGYPWTGKVGPFYVTTWAHVETWKQSGHYVGPYLTNRAAQ